MSRGMLRRLNLMDSESDLLLRLSWVVVEVVVVVVDGLGQLMLRIVVVVVAMLDSVTSCLPPMTSLLPIMTLLLMAT